MRSPYTEIPGLPAFINNAGPILEEFYAIGPLLIRQTSDLLWRLWGSSLPALVSI